MAQSLILFVTHKDGRGENEYLSLGEWISDIAKPMSSEGIFSFTDDYRPFTPSECLVKVRHYVETHYGEAVDRLMKEREDCLDAIGRASNVEVLNELTEQLHDIRRCLSELKSERKQWERLISALEICRDIWENNDWPRFYYTNN